MTDQRRIVDSNLILFKGLIEAVYILPLSIDERTVAAVASDLAGYALIDSAVAFGRFQQIGVRMGVDIYKAGANHVALSIKDKVCAVAQVLSYCCNSAAFNGYVTMNSGLSVAHINDTIPDDSIKCLFCGNPAA